MASALVGSPVLIGAQPAAGVSELMVGGGELVIERSSDRSGFSPDLARYGRLDVPVVRHSSVSQVQDIGGERGVHVVSVEGMPDICFYGDLHSSDELWVGLHGSVSEYPTFQRVRSMQGRVQAFISFADPTLYSRSNDFTIGWYLGAEGWDPVPVMASLIQRVAAEVGARWVGFVGSSAGGFAALRLARLIPGSLALVQDPQSSIGRYYAGHRDRYFAECWPGWEWTELLRAFPERFDMVATYARESPNNYIYYRQSVLDRFHLENHAIPFEESVGSGSATRGPNDRIVFAYEVGQVPGHGKITASEFDETFSRAVEFWRSSRLEFAC